MFFAGDAAGAAGDLGLTLALLSYDASTVVQSVVLIVSQYYNTIIIV